MNFPRNVGLHDIYLIPVDMGSIASSVSFLISVTAHRPIVPQ